jgi:hypothetical protein
MGVLHRALKRMRVRLGEKTSRDDRSFSYGSKFYLEPLEPRMLLSADAAVPLVDALTSSALNQNPSVLSATVEDSPAVSDPVVQGGSTDSAPTANISSLIAAVDPDDQISEAIATSVGSTVRGETISPDDDVDMYRFTVTANQQVGFDIDLPSKSTLDSFIRLFDASGTELAFNDDAAAPGEPASTESYLEYTFSTAGTYYLGVSGYPNSAYNAVTGDGDVSGNTGDYTLILNNIVDLDDQISEAIVTSVGSTVTGKAINPEDDVDMYRFSLTANQRVGFDID